MGSVSEDRIYVLTKPSEDNMHVLEVALCPPLATEWRFITLAAGGDVRGVVIQREGGGSLACQRFTPAKIWWTRGRYRASWQMQGGVSKGNRGKERCFQELKCNRNRV